MALRKTVAARLGAGGMIALCGLAPAEAQRTPPACASLSAGRVPAEVVAVVAETLRLPPSRVGPESRLAQDLGADELAEVEVAMAIEKRFGVFIATARVAPNVRGLAEVVAAMLGRQCGR